MASILAEINRDKSCSCLSSFDGQGDGNCAVHKEASK